MARTRRGGRRPAVVAAPAPAAAAARAAAPASQSAAHATAASPSTVCTIPYLSMKLFGVIVIGVGGILFSSIIIIMIGTTSSASSDAATPVMEDAVSSSSCSADIRSANGDCPNDDNDDDDDIVLAWPPPSSNASPTPFLEILFPDLIALRNSWENHPLLSRRAAAAADPSSPSSTSPDGRSIPTIFRPPNRPRRPSDPTHPSPLLHHRHASVLAFAVDDAAGVLTQPALRHGRDYKLLKKVIKDGEEWTGHLPAPAYAFEEILRHFNLGGFSLKIPHLQKRVAGVAAAARQLEDEAGVAHVGVNLYLTPDAVAASVGARRAGAPVAGFESHWDWMDVVVVQTAGAKLWSVAREPTVFLSNKDQKRKPTVEEMRHYADDGGGTTATRENGSGDGGRYDEFVLCPGDALYIPRGYVHNASTVLLSAVDASCPPPPGGVDRSGGGGAHTPNSAAGPSLHLTFGLEQGCHGTLEALLHYALHDCVVPRTTNDNHAGGDEAREEALQLIQSTVVPADRCHIQDQNGNHRATAARDVTWKAVLHHAIAEVARRECECDHPSFRGVTKPTTKMTAHNNLSNGTSSRAGEQQRRPPRVCSDDGTTAILRRSVAITQNGGGGSFSSTGGKATTATSNGEEHLRWRAALKRRYLRGLDILSTHADAARTYAFLHARHAAREAEDPDLVFCFPGSHDGDSAVPCPLALRERLAPEPFSRALAAFASHAAARFEAAYEAMEGGVTTMREASREAERAELRRVGQLQ